MQVRENEPFGSIGVNGDRGQTGKADLSKVRIESKVPEKLDRLFSVNGKITMISWEQILSDQ